MGAERCPRCNGETVVTGCPASPDGSTYSPCFVPFHIKSRLWAAGVPLISSLGSCASCGFVWASLDPEQLRACIAKHGTETLKQRLEEIESGRYRGLPDVPEARVAADKVAEIDALILAGKSHAAIRRFRELAGVIWDEAIAIVPGWEDLERGRKLALFGWSPEEKPKKDDPGLSDHPLRDRLLDG